MQLLVIIIIYFLNKSSYIFWSAMREKKAYIINLHNKESKH